MVAACATVSFGGTLSLIMFRMAKSVLSFQYLLKRRGEQTKHKILQNLTETEGSTEPISLPSKCLPKEEPSLLPQSICFSHLSESAESCWHKDQTQADTPREPRKTEEKMSLNFSSSSLFLTLSSFTSAVSVLATLSESSK